MFDLTGQRPWSPAPPAASAAPSRAALHAQGCHVVLAGRRREALRGARRRARRAAQVVTADLADAAAADGLVGRRGRRPLDILVNNAGITRDMLALRMKDEDWQAVLDTNLSAAFRLVAGGAEGHDEAPLRPDRRHHLDRRRDRQSRARPTTPPPRPA